MSILIALNQFLVSYIHPEAIERAAPNKVPVSNSFSIAILSKNICNQIIRNWNCLTVYQKKYILISSLTFITSFYIISPTLFPSKKMFTKRPDKHTTGLINLRNDCFANSSLQAYLSLPGLTDYLNKFIGTYQTIQRLVPPSIEEEIEKDEAKRGVPLHIALAKIMKKLQETQLTSRTVSVWTFLHTLEAIFHAKISRSQHDAHELTQLINETLENENLRVHKILKRAKYEERDDINVAVREQLNALEIPEFPLSGLTVTRMDCLSCKHTSQPSFVPFLMLTLNTPEKSSTDLETILDENESETIEGYQCLKCRISKILQNEEYLKRDVNDPEEMEFIQQIVQLNSRPQLYINEDIPEELENYIKSYNVGGLDIATVSSNVLRKNQILKPPKIFGIHLSRSSFDGINITRNACRVAFKDHLTLSIGKDYTDKLQQFQDNEREVEQISDRMKKVLTTDVNDMEDEDVQREDIDEKGEDDEDETTGSSATETETETEGENSTEKEDEDDDLDVDSDTSSLTSQESAGAESISTTATLKAGSSNTGEALIFSAQGLQSLQTRATEYSSITKNQSDNLKRHFKSFKFNENDIYKYKLKALIRHQGSHSQGHYECYKRKPLYVKGKDGTIFKLSPEISDETIGDMSYHVSVVDEAGMSNSSSETDAEELKNGGQFRRRFSTMMGARRPSIVQSHQEDANIHEIINSGAQTPAELLIDNPEQDYFGNFEDPFKKSGKEEVKKPEKKKVKMTKIPSLIKNPYWRISDAQVVEVSRNSVLFETTTVYMLYYERVDRKQIKR